MKYIRTRRLILLTGFLLLTAAVAGIVTVAGSRSPGLSIVARIQIVPALITLFTSFSTVLLIWLLLVTLLTFTAGRIYCTSICPLGMVQEFVSLILNKKKTSVYKPRPVAALALLAAAVVSAAAGWMSLLLLSDPYAVFTRGTALLGQPAALALQSGAVRILELFGSFALKEWRINPASIPVLAVSVLPLLLTVILALFKGRWFCHTLCPLGRLLSMPSRRARYGLVLNADKCIRCGKCRTSCPVDAVQFPSPGINQAECVRCFRCAAVCPADAIRWQRTPQPLSVPDLNRRQLLTRWLPAAGAGLAGFLLLKRTPASAAAVIPPGGGNLERFTAACIACGRCLSACPTGVLTPAFGEYGLAGLLQPRLDYSHGFCSFPCTNCISVCPTGALQSLPLHIKQRTALGESRFNRERCIIITDGTACGACAEHCPTVAITMQTDPATGRKIPAVDKAFCIGCGHCELICPAKPVKAIRVKGYTEHRLAADPSAKRKPRQSGVATDGGNPIPF